MTMVTFANLTGAAALSIYGNKSNLNWIKQNLFHIFLLGQFIPILIKMQNKRLKWSRKHIFLSVESFFALLGDGDLDTLLAWERDQSLVKVLHGIYLFLGC